ncbi:hypothetical protein Pmani_019523 [Petrolisthes manimaculis]|uniref:Ig-like domain-containing protein n=1 Tax=Petrolisthes manimaculis TaxID=1843537 RepID=A0AAE1PI50_9EUCA|nr:hypothetical protein Pmani_019523 [Petrolisthes manimaculis]
MQKATTLLAVASLAWWVTCVTANQAAFPGQAVIVNGTQVILEFTEKAWLYCYAEVSMEYQLHQCQIKWMRGNEDVDPWSVYITGPQVFSLGRSPHLIHSYLVFYPFVQIHTDVYTCVLTCNGVSIHQATINVLESSVS